MQSRSRTAKFEAPSRKQDQSNTKTENTYAFSQANPAANSARIVKTCLTNFDPRYPVRLSLVVLVSVNCSSVNRAVGIGHGPQGRRRRYRRNGKEGFCTPLVPHLACISESPHGYLQFRITRKEERLLRVFVRGTVYMNHFKTTQQRTLKGKNIGNQLSISGDTEAIRSG